MTLIKPPCTNSRERQLQLINAAERKAELLQDISELLYALKIGNDSIVSSQLDTYEDISAEYNSVFFENPTTDIARMALNKSLYYDLVKDLIEHARITDSNFISIIWSRLWSHKVVITEHDRNMYIRGEGLRYKIVIPGRGTFYCDGTSGITFEHSNGNSIEISHR